MVQLYIDPAVCYHSCVHLTPDVIYIANYGRSPSVLLLLLLYWG